MSEGPHLALLRALVDAGIRFVTWGSMAQRLLGAQLEPHDVDVLLAPGALADFIAFARARGGALTVWGEPWREDWTEASLRGRHYVRWVHEGLQVDATFEDAVLDPGSLYARARWRAGVPICPEPELTRSRTRARD